MYFISKHANLLTEFSVLVCHRIDLPGNDDFIEAETCRRDVTNNDVLLNVLFVESNIAQSSANFRNFPCFFLSFAHIPPPSLSFVRLVYINLPMYTLTSPCIH